MSPRYLILRSQVIRPGSLTRLWQMPSGVALLNLPLKPSDRITLFAGQPDPADASHFTIDYVLNQDSGTIDGWLRAHGTIDLRPRQGAITSHPAGAPAMIWRPLATTAPITNPASHLPATLPSPR